MFSGGTEMEWVIDLKGVKRTVSGSKTVFVSKTKNVKLSDILGEPVRIKKYLII